MKAKLRALRPKLERRLLDFDHNIAPLPGISLPERREAFIAQLVDSISRVKFVRTIAARNVHESRTDPNGESFDPIKAAIWHRNQGNIDEAFWLTFLSIHFGMNLRGKWRLARDVYGKLGGPGRWDWAETAANPQAFREWLSARRGTLEDKSVKRGFGNHRKYESLNGLSTNGTGNAIATYVEWIGPSRSHRNMLRVAVGNVGTDRRTLFHYLYGSMGAVARFGRTAKFDFLTMLGKLDLAPIEPGSTYMDGATGPYMGSKLLLAGSSAANGSRKFLDALMIRLADHLNVGAQEMEDALCNWQKKPNSYHPFRG